jgi:hypothetical protein
MAPIGFPVIMNPDTITHIGSPATGPNDHPTVHHMSVIEHSYPFHFSKN